MESLSNWHRYVDQVSRPARRGDTADAPGWRPWNPTPDADAVETAVRPDAIPDLAVALGAKGPSETVHAATTEYRDPTVHDVLAPIPTFSAPQLRAPTFEVLAPRIGPNGVPDRAASETSLPPVAGAEATASSLGNETSFSESQSLNDPTDADDYDGLDDAEAGGNGKEETLRSWDLLSQFRSHDVAQNSYKSTFRETREELIQRLLDPPLTLEETARLLGVCPTTVRRYTNKGHLRHFRTSGNQRRFRLSDVREFLESRASEIAADAQADRDAGHQA